MRVISGKARGTKLNTIESEKTRPTLDRVKESLFNILQYDIKDTVVLDLFAGSGALGIESLSRGAKKAYFCDTNIDAIKVIKQNLERTNLQDNAIVEKTDFEKFLNTFDKKNYFDIIFLDPPYKLNYSIIACDLIVKNSLLKHDGMIIIETDEKARDTEELKKIDELEIFDERKYGRANLIFIKQKVN